jgi:hypothetical protein
MKCNAIDENKSAKDFSHSIKLRANSFAGSPTIEC